MKQTRDAVALHDVPTNPVADAFRTAIAAQLKTLTDEPVTMKTLEKIQRFCGATRQALLAIETPEAKVRGRFGGLGSNDGISLVSGGLQIESDSEMSDNGPYVTAPNIETYGANMPRQLMATISKLGEKLGPKPSAKDIVDAIVEAEQRNEKEVAQTLREHLLTTFGDTAKTPTISGPTNDAIPANSYQTNGDAS